MSDAEKLPPMIKTDVPHYPYILKVDGQKVNVVIYQHQ
jgi:hypothetical protein